MGCLLGNIRLYIYLLFIFNYKNEVECIQEFGFVRYSDTAWLQLLDVFKKKYIIKN